jgi:arsenite-transporting ATPase
MKFIDSATRYVFFTGKGGVGKTSIACATAIILADSGRRVLLVSTDPASNLDDVLGVALSSRATAIESVPRLFAMNINPEEAARNYRERVVGPYRDALPAESVASIEEQLSGACTVEVAALDEFTALISNEGFASGFDHIVFDTAPTGHTLRLLRLPAAWNSFLKKNESGVSCLGPLSGLKTQHARYAAAVETLADPDRTALVLVTRPDRHSMLEAERTSNELEVLGLRNQFLVVNAVFRASDRNDRVAIAFETRSTDAMAEMPEKLHSLPCAKVSLRGHNIIGIVALRNLMREPSLYAIEPVDNSADTPALPQLSTLVSEIASSGHGLIMVMGKGGVGKTTIAAAIATELASRGLPVHLTTTDPAAHVATTLGEEVEGLQVSRIDAEAETRAYKQRIIDDSRKELDAAGLVLLEEDLRSPCTEEVAVFHAFSRIVSQAKREIVVMDTAPTGHTLLLLDATGGYHREVMRTSGSVAKNMVTPMMRLRDQSYTKVLVATLPETTPVLEAAQLQNDLRRAGIEPFAWIINSSLAATGTKDPVLLERAQSEIEQIEKVREGLASRVVVVPWKIEEPVGPERLRDLAREQIEVSVAYT